MSEDSGQEETLSPSSKSLCMSPAAENPREETVTKRATRSSTKTSAYGDKIEEARAVRGHEEDSKTATHTCDRSWGPRLEKFKQKQREILKQHNPEFACNSPITKAFSRGIGASMRAHTHEQVRKIEKGTGMWG